MQRTLHYNFPLFEGEDVPSIIESWNPTMAALDTKLYQLSVGNAGPEIIHELEQLIATVNELIGTVNDVISEVDDIQDTVNGVQYNVNTILNTVRHLQEEIDDIIADIPDTSQIEQDISNLQTAVGSLETRVTNLGNSIISIGNKAATSVQLRYASNLPVTPVFNPDTGVYEVEVPFREFEEGATPPSDITAFNMNCQAFLYSGYNINFFVTMPDNERELITTLINNNAYKVFTSIKEYIYQDNGNDVTVKYFAPDYVNAISTSIPVASEYRLGGIKVGSGLSIERDGTLNATGGGQSLSDAEIGCKSLIYQIRKNMEVDNLRDDYNIKALYSYWGRAHFGLAPEYVTADKRGAFALDVELTSLNVHPTDINAQFSVKPNVDLGAYISYNLRSMKRNATLIDGLFHTDATDNTPTMISGLGTYEEDYQTPGTYVFRPYCNYRLNWYDLVQSGDLTNDQFQLLQNAIYQYNKPYQQELFTFGFGNTNNPASPLVKLCIMADVSMDRSGININLSLKYSSYDLTHSPSVFPTGYTKPSDYVKTPVFIDVSSTERQTTVALGALDGASAMLSCYKPIAMVGTPSSFSLSNVVLDQAWFNLILAEGNAISD